MNARTATSLQRLRHERGQSMVEFAMVLPFLLVIVLGVVEVGYALLDQHVVTKMSREGANLISRDSTLQQAEAALRSMSGRPIDFADGSKAIFSVLKQGATVGTANYGQMILYARHEFGNLGEASHVQTAGGGGYGGPPYYEAANSDNNTGLRVTSLPSNLISVPGGFIYVVEVYTRHELITPFDRFGVNVPDTLYSIAFF
jgi:hypothetical protein